MLCATAAEYEGTVIDDIVPGHTGKGADFRLAEMGYEDYPGHLPHGLDRARGLGAAARRPRRPRQRQPRRGDRSGARARRLHHRPPPAGDLLRARHQGDQLVGDALREGRRRRGPALGLPALLQGGPAVDQLAGSELLRHAARDRRRAARPGRPRRGRPAAGRERLPRRREERGGGARVVGGPSALGGREPLHRVDDPQDGRVLLPGAEPVDGRHQDDGRVRRRSVLRLRQPARLPPRARHRRHRVPAPDAEPRAGHGHRPGVAGPRDAEPRRAHARARALLHRPPRRSVPLARGRRCAGRSSRRRSGRRSTRA